LALLRLAGASPRFPHPLLGFGGGLRLEGGGGDCHGNGILTQEREGRGRPVTGGAVCPGSTLPTAPLARMFFSSSGSDERPNASSWVMILLVRSIARLWLKVCMPNLA